MNMPNSKIVHAFPSGDFCGEGLIWSDEQQCLFWTDINRFLIHRHVPGGSNISTWAFDEPVCALARTDKPGILLVALASKLIYWQPENDKRRDHGFTLEGAPNVRLNDGSASPSGDFWVGSMKNNVGLDGTPQSVKAGLGNLYCVSPEKSEILDHGFGVSNTLCWSPDQKTFYFADTLENCIYAYDHDPATGAISNRRTFFKGHPRGLPDGSAMDADGYLWNCRWGGGCIIRISPNGAVDTIIEAPIDNVTTCAFGDADRRTLYITSAQSENRFQRQAGDLFRFRTKVSGAEDYYVSL